MQRRNQLLALFCVVVFFAFGVFYFRYWVIQKPFGIVLFIAGGLDANRLATARLQARTADSVAQALALDSLPYTALLRNSSADSALPDEAAAATALATGQKVKNGAIAIDAEGNPVATLVEVARDSGRMTGLVTNGDLTATALASFYAHAPASVERAEFARQLVDNAKIDVVLGRSPAEFLPHDQEGRRSDGRNLFEELSDDGYDLVQTLEELDEIPRWRRAKLFGFLKNEQPNAANAADKADEPSDLGAMVRRAIELLQFNRGGYLLIVDASSLRNAIKEGDAQRITLATLELDRAVAVAMEYSGTKSAIFVCGDVAMNTPAVGAGSSPARTPAPVEPAPSMSQESAPSAGDADVETSVPDEEPSANPIPVSTPNIATVPGLLQMQQAPEDVLAFGKGLGADALHGVLENTALFEIIQDNL